MRSRPPGDMLLAATPEQNRRAPVTTRHREDHRIPREAHGRAAGGETGHARHDGPGSRVPDRHLTGIAPRRLPATNHVRAIGRDRSAQISIPRMTAQECCVSRANETLQTEKEASRLHSQCVLHSNPRSRAGSPCTLTDVSDLVIFPGSMQATRRRATVETNSSRRWRRGPLLNEPRCALSVTACDHPVNRVEAIIPHRHTRADSNHSM